MTQRWIVDAMNVIGSRPDGWWKNRRSAMGGLVDQLERWNSTQGHDVTVVFERPPSPPITSHVIAIAHAPKAAANSADDEIVRLVQCDDRPHDLTVVTSDSALADRVRRAGASVHPAAAFRNLIDPLGGRQPTSHERMAGQPWDASYHDGPAPWDIDMPQPAVVRLASEGGFAGAVLDAGCGTGENALHIASLGLSVLGFDVAETALAIAREKAADRGIGAEFVAGDALHVERLGAGPFDTVLDCGLFHTFDADERAAYVAGLKSVTRHDGTLYVLCFSDEGLETGPHPISEKELRAAFNAGSGWAVSTIEPDRIHTRYHDDGAPAWCATLKRI